MGEDVGQAEVVVRCLRVEVEEVRHVQVGRAERVEAATVAGPVQGGPTELYPGN